MSRNARMIIAIVVSSKPHQAGSWLPPHEVATSFEQIITEWKASRKHLPRYWVTKNWDTHAVLGTSWYSKTSFGITRGFQRDFLYIKKDGSLLGSLSHQRSLTCNDSTTKRPLWANLASASRGSKSYSLATWVLSPQFESEGPKKDPKSYFQRQPKQASLCGYASQQKPNNPSKNICISGESSATEMQSCDRATWLMKVTVVTGVLTLPSQIPSPTIDAVM